MSLCEHASRQCRCTSSPICRFEFTKEECFRPLSPISHGVDIISVFLMEAIAVAKQIFGTRFVNQWKSCPRQSSHYCLTMHLGCVAFRDLEAVRRRELLSVSLPLLRKYARVAISSDSPGRIKIEFHLCFISRWAHCSSSITVL